MKKLFYLLAGIVAISCTKTEDNKQQINNDQRYSISVSGEKTAIENTSSGTRVEMLDDVLHWSVGDKIKMLIFEHGAFNEGLDAQSYAKLLIDIEESYAKLLIDDLPMTGQHDVPVTQTNFMGEISFEEISKLHSDNLYDYLSFYPHLQFDINDDNIPQETVPQIAFQFTVIISGGAGFVPSEISTRSNTFPSQAIRLMCLLKNTHPIAWLDENDEPQWGEGIEFKYKHVFSYLRVKIESNEINSLSVNSVSLKIPAQGFYPYGQIEANSEGVVIISSNSIISSEIHTTYIEDGMNVGDYIYIPLPSADYTQRYEQMTFEFTFEDGTTWSKSIQGSIAEQGKVHNIGFNIR